MTAAAPPRPRFGVATGGLPSTIELDRARAIGCDLVELGLRWGQHDLLPRAAEVVEGCRSRGLEPVVVLHVGGPEPWVDLDAPDRFRTWAETVAAALTGCTSWLPVLRPNHEALRRHLHGGVRSTRDLLRALDHQLAAHVLAADVVRSSGGPSPVLTCSIGGHRLYELDTLLLDVLLAPAAGIARDDLGPFLRERRLAHQRAQDVGGLSPRHRLHRRLAASVIPLEQALPRAISEAYATRTSSVDRLRRAVRPLTPPAAPVPLDLEETTDEAQDPDGPDPIVWRASADEGYRRRIAATRASSLVGAGDPS